MKFYCKIIGLAFVITSFGIGVGSAFAALPLHADLAGHVRPLGNVTMGALEPNSSGLATPSAPTGLQIFIN